MPHKIAVFFHCLFYLDDKVLYPAFQIVDEQMTELERCGLLAEADHFMVGVNGGVESERFVNAFIPKKAKVVYHGLENHTENSTLLALQLWARENPDWYVFYFHAKGSTRPVTETLSVNWRACMMRNIITNWRTCVKDLDRGYDVVGCHFMAYPKTPKGQAIFAGNTWCANSNYLATIPLITERDRIKLSGIGALESRYEAEVLVGNEGKLTRVLDYHKAWIDQCVP